MIERNPNEKVKDVGVDNDCLCIELLNGVRLMGPLRTKPIYRDAVVPREARTLPGAEFSAVAAS
jgi:hypothetical protein